MASTRFKLTQNLAPTIITRSSKQLEQRNFTTVILRDKSEIKPYYEIPTPSSFLPSSISLMMNGGPQYLHEHCDKRHQKFGPIYREHLGKTELVFVANNKMIQKVVSHEGQFPQHNVPIAWSFYNELKKVQRGLFFQTGESWSRLRQAFNKVMLADPRSITRYSVDILKINEALFRDWSRNLSRGQSRSMIIRDLKNDLCKWSIESTGYMLFGDRINCICGDPNTKPDLRAEELVRNVSEMFSQTSKLQLIPVELAYKLNLATWRRFEKASTKMVQIAAEFTNEFIDRAKRSNLDRSLIGDLMKTKALSNDEISRSVVDLIIAAADTTSNSLQWMLYRIAKDKEIQSKIYNEVEPLLDSPLDLENFRDQTPYLKAFMREVHRLYPTAPFLARTLDKDIELGGYSIPAGKSIIFSLYTTSRCGDYFEKPLQFKPERWLRSNRGDRTSVCPSKENHAYASLPFGIGRRMCIGRRAAELEMGLFIASFVNAFESSLVDENADDVGIKLKMILIPNRPINLKLKPRQV